MKSLVTKALGRTGFQISRVGLGSAAFGGKGWTGSWGSQDDRASVATILHAVEAGINWIDTAPIYGQGHAETLVGRALREIPLADRPYVFTKCGLVWQSGAVGARRTLTPKSMRLEVQASLRRLGVERIDLYQIHHQPEMDSPPIEESWAEMDALKAEGLIGAVGVCNFSVDHLGRCEPVHHVDTLQVRLSLIHREVLLDVVPWSRAHGTGVIAYRSIEAGLLTDGFSSDGLQNLDTEDWRSSDPDFRSPRLERHLRFRTLLVPLAEARGTSVASIALAWALAASGVSAAIVGARHPRQIDGWLQAGDIELTATEIELLDHELRKSSAGDI